MERFWKLVSSVLVGVAVVMVTIFAGAPAQAETRQSATAAHVQQVDGQPGTLSAGQCVGYLSATGYTVTTARLTACVAGSVQTPTAIPACTAALVITGVWFRVAAAACGLAAIP